MHGGDNYKTSNEKATLGILLTKKSKFEPQQL
jgi:hypothetical protein